MLRLFYKEYEPVEFRRTSAEKGDEQKLLSHRVLTKPSSAVRIVFVWVSIHAPCYVFLATNRVC